MAFLSPKINNSSLYCESSDTLRLSMTILSALLNCCYSRSWHKLHRSFYSCKFQYIINVGKCPHKRNRIESRVLNGFEFLFLAFTSWICYYKTFSKDLRHMFNLREIHMGHIANNFGLRDAPKSIVKQHSKNEEGKKER